MTKLSEIAFILMVSTILTFSLLIGCRCITLENKDMKIKGCSIFTDPVGVVVMEPNRLVIGYQSETDNVNVLMPYGRLETK